MGDIGTSCKKFLLLESAAAEIPELREILAQIGQVRTEPTMEAALIALQRDTKSLFVSPAGEILAAEQNGLGFQLSSVLDTIGQGVCLLDIQGRTLWSNARIRELPWEVRDRIQRHCRDGYSRQEGRSILGRSRSLSLITDGEQYFEARITPILDQHGLTRLVVSVSDVTRPRRLQKKVDAIDNAGREIVQVDAEQLAGMNAGDRLQLLERKIIRYTRELLHFDNFAIRLVDKRNNRLELALCAGLPPEAQTIDLYVSPEGSGISGYVASTGRSYICPDVGQDARYLPGINNARSSLTVPLKLHDKVIGVFNIESDRVAAFSEEDRQFTEIFARYIAIALHILDLLVVERFATTGRLADNVSAEIAGPLGDILADATTLTEDYIGHDDLRHRLQGIIDNVARIRECIKQVTKPVQSILEAKGAPPEKDPVLAGKTVLVIDDEEIIRTTVRDVLARSGCDVELAAEGKEAMAMINQRFYDLVISDIRMPNASGYEIFRLVKENKPHCPVMFMTGFGYDPSHSIIRATPEGLAAVLYKPFKVNELLEAVRSAISSATPK
ncbi:MAG TPA: response regulator [Phycisphaerae bacterium]|nr:response regulator [Phycisphaerae bacterium]HRY67792.1 response regulator [Phycisphaerae bacterium]HSA25244.1 response regulator [Phycisphaerae bacterium]